MDMISSSWGENSIRSFKIWWWYIGSKQQTFIVILSFAFIWLKMRIKYDEGVCVESDYHKALTTQNKLYVYRIEIE